MSDTTHSYAAHDDDLVIWGCGPTAAAAVAEARDYGWTGVEPPTITPITPALAAVVADRGGHAVNEWDFLADTGTLGTASEVAAAADLAAEHAAAMSAAVEASLAPGECADWLAERREMLTAMAAQVSWDGRVQLSKRGLLLWSAEAPLVRDAAPRQGGRLSHDRGAAAREMRENLSDPTWVLRQEAEEQAALRARRDALADIGHALHGPEWISPLARGLGVAVRTVQRWAAGEIAVPHNVTQRELPELVRRLGPARLAEMERAARVLRAAIAAS